MALDQRMAREEWARLGALARLEQIEQERLSILEVFPDLRRSALALSSSKPTRARRTISTKGRKAMSAGMRRYWAKRKAGKVAETKSAKSA